MSLLDKLLGLHLVEQFNSIPQIQELNNIHEQLDLALQPTAQTVGFALDQFKFIVCLLLSFVLVGIHKFFTNVTLRHIYAIFWGVAFGWFLFGVTVIHSFISSTLLYFLVRVLCNSKQLPLIALLFSFGYMTVAHVYRQYYDYLGWTLDYTASQMIVTLKLVAFAFDTYDAHKKDTKAPLPSTLEFYSYIYYFPNFLAGPFFEYDEYKAFIDLSMFKSTKGKIPFSFKAFGTAFFWILYTLIGVIVVAPKFPSSKIYTDEFLYNTPLLEQLPYMWLAFYGVRSNYFSCWAITEAISIVSGFGYAETKKGDTTVVSWDRMKNVNIWKWETSQNLYSIVGNWNIRVAGWLKKYIYLRLAGNSKPSSIHNYATFAVSAFWHGFYPGYYMFFLFWPFFTSVAAGFRRTLRTIFLKSDGKENYPFKYVYDLLSFAATLIATNYLVISFHFLSFDRSLKVYAAFHYAIHIACIVLWVLVNYLPFLIPRKKITPPTATAATAKKTE